MDPTIGLLLHMLAPIFNLGFMVILDSGFCALKAIIELRKKGVFASALITKRRSWPKYIHGEEIKEHFAEKKLVQQILGRARWMMCHSMLSQ